MYRSVRPNFASRSAGLTLVEVLVCLLIVCVLLAVLLPGIRRVQDLRDEVGCLASLHQVGLAVTQYAADTFGRLPTHHGGGSLAFDTFWMRDAAAREVNLGRLGEYISDPSVYYCPTQNADTSPDLAFNTDRNKWPKKKLIGRADDVLDDIFDDGIPGNGHGNGLGSGPAARAGAGLNSSFATRTRQYPASQASWRIHNYANKVVYTDFTGVNAWAGTGRFHGATIASPHRREGYNRLFGNGSAVWIAAPRVQGNRPVTDVVPTAQEMHEYYQLLDVVP